MPVRRDDELYCLRWIDADAPEISESRWFSRGLVEEGVDDDPFAAPAMNCDALAEAWAKEREFEDVRSRRCSFLRPVSQAAYLVPRPSRRHAEVHSRSIWAADEIG